MSIPITEDSIAVIAEQLYGKDSDDFNVFKAAAEVRKKRRQICIEFRRLRDSGESYDDSIYTCSKKYNSSMNTVKDIIRKKDIYDPKWRR